MRTVHRRILLPAMHKTLFSLAACVALLCLGCNKRDDQDTARAGNVATQTASNTNNPAENIDALANTVGRDLSRTADQAADAARTSITAKAREWKLTADDVRADLEKSGRIVRSKANDATDTGSMAADSTAISSQIRTKYAADPDLSATDIRLQISQGVVSLDGEVANPDQLGRAIALALDTTGVHEVVSNLKVQNKD